MGCKRKSYSHSDTTLKRSWKSSPKIDIQAHPFIPRYIVIPFFFTHIFILIISLLSYHPIYLMQLSVKVLPTFNEYCSLKWTFTAISDPALSCGDDIVCWCILTSPRCRTVHCAVCYMYMWVIDILERILADFWSRITNKMFNKVYLNITWRLNNWLAILN